MKICFEGPSSIGKTTLAKLFESHYAIIPEVNQLFIGSTPTGKWWYHQKQVERYQLSSQYEKSIFDGDPFQPLWYNWTYNFPSLYQPLVEMQTFYLHEIRQNNLHFPDAYIIFQTSEDNLRQRKAKDTSRSRRGFEKHLKLCKSIPSYFGHMAQHFPNRVIFLDYDNIQSVYGKVKRLLMRVQSQPKKESELILTSMVNWLNSHTFTP